MNRRDLPWIAALLVAVAAVYAPLYGAGFTNWDDDRFVTANPLFQTGGWTYVTAAWDRVQFEAYHPLHLLSYLPDRYLWPNAAGFHTFNVALFALGVALAFVLARRHVPAAAAAAACLLFALHPLRVEPVAWISARKDLLALIFFLGVLLVEDRHESARPRALALLLSAAALLSKTSTVALPLVVFAWLLWVRRRPLKTALLRAAPHALLAAVAGVAIAVLWKDHELVVNRRPAHAVVDVAATLATYTWRLVWPARLSPLYPEAAPAQYVAAAAFAAGLIALALGWRRLPPLARFAAVAFYAALLPVANILPIYFRFGDRYTLLAGAMLVLPVAGLIRSVAQRRAAAAVVVALATAEAAIAAPLAGTWRDSKTLWAHAAAAQPKAHLARLKNGETLRELGDWKGAIAEYQAIVRLRPDSTIGYLALFYCYARRAEVDGQVAPRTADYWLRELEFAISDPEAFGSLRRRVGRSCRPCAGTLLLLGLRKWPQPDDALLAEARRALDAGARDQALIYLTEMKDHGGPEWGELMKRAGAP